jgi:hypothetical protein
MVGSLEPHKGMRLVKKGIVIMLQTCRLNNIHVADKTRTDVGGKFSYSCAMKLIDRREFDIGSDPSSESDICRNYKVTADTRDERQ